MQFARKRVLRERASHALWVASLRLCTAPPSPDLQVARNILQQYGLVLLGVVGKR